MVAYYLSDSKFGGLKLILNLETYQWAERIAPPYKSARVRVPFDFHYYLLIRDAHYL